MALSIKDRGVTPRALAIIGLGLAVLGSVFLPAGTLISGGFGSAALLLAAVCLQLRWVANVVEKIMVRDSGTRSRYAEAFDNVLDRAADIAVFVSVGYSIGGGTIGPLLGWLAALLSLATSYVAMLSSNFLEAATYPMNQKHRMAVVSAACVVASLFPVAVRAIAMYGATVAVVLGCGFTLWLKLPRLLKNV